jgi:hypothetical protein
VSGPPEVGVWQAIGRLGGYTIRELLWPEGIFGLAIGLGGSVAIVNGTRLADRVDAVGDVLVLGGALLAVVFTALALVVSIPSTDYMRKMADTPNGGILRFLDPFMVAAGTQVAVLLLGFGYKLAAAHVPWQIEHAVFYVLSFFVVFGLLDIVALARSLVRHGVNRGIEALGKDGEQDGGDIHPLRRTNPPT